MFSSGNFERNLQDGRVITITNYTHFCVDHYFCIGSDVCYIIFEWVMLLLSGVENIILLSGFHTTVIIRGVAIHAGIMKLQ